MMLFKVHLGWIIRIKEQQKALYLVSSLVSLVDEKIQLLIWLLLLRMALNGPNFSEMLLITSS